MLDVALISTAILSLLAILLRAWNKRPIKTQLPPETDIRPRPLPPEEPDVPKHIEDNQSVRDRLRALRLRSKRLRAELDEMRGRD